MSCFQQVRKYNNDIFSIPDTNLYITRNIQFIRKKQTCPLSFLEDFIN